MKEPEKLVFESTIYGLFVRGLGSKLTPRLKEKLRAEGLDLDKKLLPAYPFEAWCRFVKVAAAEVFAGEPPETAYARLGELVLEGFRATITGPALLGIVRILGPKRALQRTKQNFRSGNNYTEAEIIERSPTHFELWMNEAGPIRLLTRGILLAGLKSAGAKDVKVDVARFDEKSAVYEIRWS